MSNIDIDLNSNICKTFRKAAADILECKVDKVVFKGGRNTTKSAVGVICGILFCLKYQCSALMVVEHSNKATERLSRNILKYLNTLGIRELFLYRKKPDRFILLDKNGRQTIHAIDIVGASDPETIRSMTPEDLGYSYVFLEEAGNFKSEQDIDDISSTSRRGDTGRHILVMAYNPPFDNKHYLNKLYGKCPCGKQLGYDSNYFYTTEHIEMDDIEPFDLKVLVHHSTYLDVYKEHPNWFGLALLGEYELQRKNNKKAWEWDKLGKVVGSDAKVFWNVTQYKYNDSIASQFANLYRGLDVSNGGTDPWAFGVWAYDRANNDIYCFGEVYEGGNVTYDKVADKIKTLNKFNATVYVDSAAPGYKNLIRNKGVNTLSCYKYPGSVKTGIIWLQSLNHIYIDPVLTPHTFAEFNDYSYIINKNNEITSELSDKDNHTIDACRYALCYVIKQ